MFFIKSIIVLILLVITIYSIFISLSKIVLMIRSGEKKKITHEWSRRIKSIIQMVFMGKKLLNDPAYGIMHFVYLYGFFILSIGHFELILFGLSSFLITFNMTPIMYKNFLPTWAEHSYEFSQDIMAFIVILIASIALKNRLRNKISRLQPRSKDAEIILWFIIALYITFFFLVSTQTLLLIHENKILAVWHWFLPISSIIAILFKTSNTNIINIINNISWWIHLLLFLGFAIYVPRSKHLHLIAAGPNIFFRNLDSVAKPTIINFEHAIKYGANQANELPWKSLLDTFACTECGRCNAVCPTAITNKPLQPKKVLYNIKMNLKHETSDNIKNKYFNKISIKCSNNNKITKKKKALIKPEYLDKNQSQRSSDQINLEEIWSCTTCAACVEVCPVIIDSVPTSLIEMRRHLILMEAKNYPKELNNCFKGLENNHNPWNITAIRKTKWEKECNVPIFSKLVNKKPEYLFYIGCAGSIDDKAKKTQQSLIKIFKKYNIDFAILGNEEKCCGDPARRLGNEYLYDILVRKNIDILKKYDITKIITACPHCFNQFKNEYKDYGINISVKHHSQILEEIISNNKISFNNKEKQNETITFHDPCYLGRYNDEYLAPRNVLTSCTQRNIKEMKMSKQKSFCCGAGGGHMFMEERLGNKISHTRLNHAIATKSHTIATACPFCIRMLNDAACDKNIEQQVQIKDIAEIFIKKII